MQELNQPGSLTWHATTIVMVRKGGKTVIGGDGQVSFGRRFSRATPAKCAASPKAR